MSSLAMGERVTMTQLAERWGLTHVMVHKMIHKMGLPTHPVRPGERGKFRLYTLQAERWRNSYKRWQRSE